MIKQYTEKIIEIAYYKFPLVPPKEHVLNAVEMLLNELVNRELHKEKDVNHWSENQLALANQQWQDKFNELYKSVCEMKEYGQFNNVTASKLNEIINKHKNVSKP